MHRREGIRQGTFEAPPDVMAMDAQARSGRNPIPDDGIHQVGAILAAEMGSEGRLQLTQPGHRRPPAR